MKSLLLSFLAGIVSACGFEPLGLWPLTLAALAFLMWQVERAPSLRNALAHGYWFGAGNFMLGLNWIATAFTYQAEMPQWLGWIAVLLLSLYIAVYPALAAGLAWRWGRHDRLVLVLVFAAAWVVTEWLRATMFTGFAWNPVGVALLPTRISYLATWIGTYGLSGVAALIAGALLLGMARRWRAALAVAASVGAATLLVPLTGGGVLPRAPLALRVVQPNINQAEKWRAGFAEINFKRLERLTGSRNHPPRLVLWPEAAITDPLQDARSDPFDRRAARELRERVGGLLGPADMLLTGGVTFQSKDGVRLSSATNSVFAVDPQGQVHGRYDKSHLVPYGEYLPARPLLSRLGLSRLAPGDVDFDAGPGAQTMTLLGVGRVGFQLCYEMIFSGEVVDRSNRPDFLFNPSNDAWFGAWGPPQHLAQAQLRALEEGLPVLRSTPTGISAIVDAEGRLLHSIPWRTAGVIDAPLPATKPPTLFAKVGNPASFLFALLLVAIAIAVRRKAV